MTDWAALIAIVLFLIAFGAVLGWRTARKGHRIWLLVMGSCWLIAALRNATYADSDDARIDVGLLIAAAIFATAAWLTALLVGRRARRRSTGVA